MPNVVVVIPTYNEIETLPVILNRLHSSVPEVSVLIVDDGSPDGTGEWVANFSTNSPWCSVIQRGTKQGLASAYTDGFRWAIDRGFTYVGQMDADGSHRPEQFARLLNRISGIDHPDGVIGSRWQPGGGVTDWALRRVLLSKAGNAYIRLLLGMNVSDATTGFRVYSTSTLVDSGILDRLTVGGYGFQAEMTYRLISAGYSVVEIPITFGERLAGQSKMSWHILFEELCQVTVWGIQKIFGSRP